MNITSHTFLTLDAAKSLKQGTIIANDIDKNSDGTPSRYKVTSVKTWKRTPSKVVIRVQHGLNRHYEINEYYLQFWYVLASDYAHVPR
jgi:hypothetical protein